MASQIGCDLCGEEYAASMITRLDNGDSLAVGEACLLTFHLTVSAELIKTLSPEHAEGYIEPVNALVDAYGQLGAAAGILPAGGAGSGSPHDTEPSEHTEGPADEHTAGTPERLDGHGSNQAKEPGSTRRPGRGGVRRPG